MQINFTQAAGLLAFIPAAVAAARASSGACRGRIDWAVISAIHALLAMEIVASGRHRLRGLADDWLRLDSVYGERRPVQLAMLIAVIVLAMLAGRLLFRRPPSGRLALARGATAAVVTLFAVETVSLHPIDMALYRPLGFMMLIGWLWLAGGLTTTFAALRR